MKCSLLKLCCIGFVNLIITGCGFHLRGSQGQVFNNPNIVLTINDKNLDNQSNQLLKDTIYRHLLSLNAKVTNTNNQSAQQDILLDSTNVSVSNVNLTKHRLVGTLTEVQLVLSAKITIQFSTKTTRRRQLLVQRSYQLNQATINTNDAEEKRIIELMYADMADKISHQVELFESTN